VTVGDPDGEGLYGLVGRGDKHLTGADVELRSVAVADSGRLDHFAISAERAVGVTASVLDGPPAAVGVDEQNVAIAKTRGDGFR
jgi:hypothetical protein